MSLLMHDWTETEVVWDKRKMNESGVMCVCDELVTGTSNWGKSSAAGDKNICQKKISYS